MWALLKSTSPTTSTTGIPFTCPTWNGPICFTRQSPAGRPSDGAPGRNSFRRGPATGGMHDARVSEVAHPRIRNDSALFGEVPIGPVPPPPPRDQRKNRAQRPQERQVPGERPNRPEPANNFAATEIDEDHFGLEPLSREAGRDDGR